MTTIAFDGTTLAADACSWSGGCRRKVRKVFKLKAPDGRQFLVAMAGTEVFCLSVLGWMRGKRDRPDPREFMEAADLNQQLALVIDEKHRCWLLWNRLFYTPTPEKIFAFGAGQDFAWGALEAGASAEQAIRIAIKRSDYAGLGVDKVRF